MAKIAVIDDSEVALDWAEQALKGGGHEVVTYGKPSGITGFIRSKKPDLVLLDVNMGNVKGDVVCKVLKDDTSLNSIIITLYSSMPDAELKALAESVGADGHITKTDSPETLSKLVNGFLS